MNRPPHISGFTTIELLVVLAILSFFLVFSLPVLRKTFTSGNGNKDLARLSELIVSLKQTALAEGVTYQLHLDLGSNKAWVSRDNMTEEELSQAQDQGMSLSPGLTLRSVVFPKGDNRPAASEVLIRFYRRGYSDPAIIHLGVDGDAVSLQIHPFLLKVDVSQGQAEYHDCA